MAKNFDDYRTNNVNVFIWLKTNKNNDIPEEIYKVDEKQFAYRILCQCNGEVHVKRHLSGKQNEYFHLFGNTKEELSWDWGTLILPEKTQNGELGCSEYKCLYFRPIMREFLAKQGNMKKIIEDKNSPLGEMYASKVKDWVESGQIFVFEAENGKVNLKPHDQNIIEHLNGKYPTTRISQRPFVVNNFINMIGTDMIGNNIKEIDPEANNHPSIVEFVESKFNQTVKRVKQFLRLEKNNEIEAVKTKSFKNDNTSSSKENEGK